MLKKPSPHQHGTSLRLALGFQLRECDPGSKQRRFALDDLALNIAQHRLLHALKRKLRR